jgi:hypothetical protein
MAYTQGSSVFTLTRTIQANEGTDSTGMTDEVLIEHSAAPGSPVEDITNRLDDIAVIFKELLSIQRENLHSMDVWSRGEVIALMAILLSLLTALLGQ